MTWNQIFMIVSPCRSGSSALLNTLTQGGVPGYYQPVKEGLRSGIQGNPKRKEPDNSFFTSPAGKGREVIVKETIGPNTEAECQYNPLPPKEGPKSRLLFLFRDPLATWNSWKKHKMAWQGSGSDVHLFIKAYRHTYYLYQQARQLAKQTQVLTYEALVQNPMQRLKQICTHWGIPFDNRMMNPSSGLLDNPHLVFTPQQEQRLKGAARDMMAEASTAKGITQRTEVRIEDSLVTPEERQQIETQLRPLYTEMVKACHQDFPESKSLILAGSRR